ncbi:hypothetical protein RND71_015458 [Anisodus tanguticus]|uniref:Uncharacterized protein n=1 Tax=Anisodus tanguticus TaxID=243964 RepID=A0AAE1S6A8_9SOLA|nr:hypothetical protein RND71_015458 [Anisodus tanguticus]
MSNNETRQPNLLLIAIWLPSTEYIVQVFMYFRGSGKAAEMKKEAFPCLSKLDTLD